MPIDIKDTDFESLVIKESNNKPVLVDFWAPWCAPCKILAPILEEVSKDLGDTAVILKINVDENPEIAGRLAIRSIPTMIIFRNGEKVDQSIGVLTREALSDLIKKYI
jgi:thioredoxin 1